MRYLNDLGENKVAYLEGRSSDLPLPMALRLQLTSYCNMNCVMCPCANNLHPKTNMTMECLEKVVSICSGKIKTVGLSYLGEPTLHPRFWDIIDYMASNADWDIGLQTNGTTMNETFIKKLLDSPIESVSVSLDTLDVENSQHYRPGSPYERILNNIYNLLETKNRVRPDFIVILRVFSDEIKRTAPKDFFKQVLHWKNLGCYSISPGRMFNHAGAITEVEDSCLCCRKHEYPCVFPWYYLVVGTNGELRPCCMDTEGLMTFKNIHEINSLEEYWNSSELSNFRSELLKNCPNNTLCKKCNWRQLISPEDLL